MAPSPKDSSLDPASTYQGGMIAINLDIHLLMLSNSRSACHLQ